MSKLQRFLERIGLGRNMKPLFPEQQQMSDYKEVKRETWQPAKNKKAYDKRVEFFVTKLKNFFSLSKPRQEGTTTPNRPHNVNKHDSLKNSYIKFFSD